MGGPEIHTARSESETVEVEDDREMSESNESPEIDASVLAGLNIVAILSILSSPAEESPNSLETGVNDHRMKHGSRSNHMVSRKRELNGFRGAERLSSKDHTKIRDCRHSRRL